MNGFSAIESLARVGFLVKGALYMVIGALAALARPADRRLCHD